MKRKGGGRKAKGGTIALITDFGLSDPFVGVMKGVILSINPNAQIVDVTHQIPPQDIRSAAFLLKYSYRYFPKGAIHLVVVDPGVGTSRKAIAVETENYFFVASDNGVISQAIEAENVRKIVELKERSYFLSNISQTFHGRDIFAPVSAYISLGTPLEKFGPEIKRVKRLHQILPQISQKKIVGWIVYIDRFGNLITNISQEIFEKASLGRDFVINFKGHEIRSLSRSYSDANVGAYSHTPLLAIFDSFDALEISVNKASAQEIFRAKIGDEVEVVFNPT